MNRFLLTAAAVFFAAAGFAGEYVRSENMYLEKGSLYPHRQFKPFFELNFREDPSIWDEKLTRHYQNLTQSDFNGTKFNQKCLLVTRKGDNQKISDTAWTVGTKLIPYKGKPGPVEIATELAASVTLDWLNPGSYRNDIEWRDAKGKVLGVTPIVYTGNSREFSVSRCKGVVPEGTASFILRVGFDSPNVNPGTYFAIRSLKIANVSGETPYVKSCCMETGPLAVSGSEIVSWKAECPAGTFISVAVSRAADKNGIPGAWSPFGAEQTRPYYEKAGWVRFRITFHSSGKNCPVLKEFSVGKQKETVWYSRVNPAVPIVENKTLSPTRNAKNDVVLRVTSETPVLWHTLKVSVDGKDVTGKLIRKGDLVTYKAEKAYGTGKHTVNVSVSNLGGASGEFTKYFLIGDGPRVPKITVRDDGMTLVDGKPFFPIGFYAVWKREFNNNDFDKCMKDLKAAGVNFIHTYSGINNPDGEKFLAAGRKYGMKFWLAMHQPDSPLFHKLVDNPDILAWYIGDDTSSHTTPQKLQDLNDHLRALDDKRITTQADGVGADKPVSNYRDFVLGSDNFLPEIYPVRKETPEDRDTCVAKVIRDMQVCRNDIAFSKTDRPRNLWSIIQYFWGWGSWRRFPDENEIRAMSFGSIIHGATGITWYTYGGYYNPKTKWSNYGVTSTPERWRIITTITKQLNRLIPVLTERSPEDQPPVPAVVSGPAKDFYGNPSVTCMLKRHNGKSYVFAVNAVRKNVKASIRLPGLGKGKVLFENRTCEVKNGVLTDDFKPYDVHIYEL